MYPTFYNNGRLILQTPGSVMIFNEMIHQTRIIPNRWTPRTSRAQDASQHAFEELTRQRSVLG
jgi:hypothetical protein